MTSPATAAAGWRRQVQHGDRDAQAATPAAHGHGYPSITETPGYGSRQDAWRGALKALPELGPMRSLDQIRGELVLELSELRRHSWKAITDPPPSFDRVGRA
jgi:hypothetical protein